MAATEDTGRINPSPSGDPEAFETIIQQHQRMIHALCYRMTGSLADAEDLAQETFVLAYQNLHKFRAESRISSWLYRIAVNQCLNWRTRRERQERLHKEWSEQSEVSSNENPTNAQHVRAALIKLSPKQRAAIILTCYDGLTHAEAAKVIGCSETTVSWRLFAARRKLKRLLKALQPSKEIG